MIRGLAYFILVVLLASPGASLRAQDDQAEADTPRRSCDLPEAQQFDFWVGKWDLEWGDGETGTNVIEKKLDGCVIVEKFDGSPSRPLRGMSVSSYNADLGKWQQTWVDNHGGYLDFVGGYADSRMVLEREAVRDGRKIRQRMVWYDIEDDSLSWNWERSTDGGDTWELLWQISYRRAQ